MCFGSVLLTCPGMEFTGVETSSVSEVEESSSSSPVLCSAELRRSSSQEVDSMFSGCSSSVSSTGTAGASSFTLGLDVS